MKDNYRIFTVEELVAQYQATQDEAILQELIIRNKGLIHGWVMKYSNIPNHDAEDLEEEAYVALWRAAQAYDPKRGYAFTSCLKGCVIQAFNRLYAANTRKKRYSGVEAVSYEELEEINKEGGYHDDHSGLELGEFLSTLSDTAKTVATMLSEGFSKSDVARALGVRPATVSYYLKRLQKAYSVYCMEV